MTAMFPPIQWPAVNPDPTATAEVPWPKDYNWQTQARPFFMDGHNYLLLAGLLYVPAVFAGQRIMRDRKAFDCKNFLIAWNLVATLFSAAGSFYLVPFMAGLFMERSVTDVLCNKTCFTHNAAQWVFYFNASKILEWTDTLLLVLRKKPVIFLHWVHHILTFFYCWHASLFSFRADCTGMFFATMNLVIHTVMYSYYFLFAIGRRVTWGDILTVFQTLQMVFGTWAVAYSAWACEDTWAWNWHGVIFGLAMYFMYFILFFKLIFDRRARRRPQQKKE